MAKVGGQHKVVGGNGTRGLRPNPSIYPRLATSWSVVVNLLSCFAQPWWTASKCPSLALALVQTKITLRFAVINCATAFSEWLRYAGTDFSET